jgi:hypothetical protein
MSRICVLILSRIRGSPRTGRHLHCEGSCYGNIHIGGPSVNKWWPLNRRIKGVLISAFMHLASLVLVLVLVCGYLEGYRIILAKNKGPRNSPRFQGARFRSESLWLNHLGAWHMYSIFHAQQDYYRIIPLLPEFPQVSLHSFQLVLKTSFATGHRGV